MPTKTLIITEGVADDAFFKKLIEANALTSLVVLEASDTNDYSNGRFGVRLAGLKTNSKIGNIKDYKCIIVVADNDDAPQELFAKIQEQIRAAKEYGVPQRPCEGFSQLAPSQNGYGIITPDIDPINGISGCFYGELPLYGLNLEEISTRLISGENLINQHNGEVFCHQIFIKV